MTEEEQSVFFEIELRKMKGGNSCLLCEGTGLVESADKECGRCFGHGIQLTTDEFDLMVRLDDSILDAEIIY